MLLSLYRYLIFDCDEVYATNSNAPFSKRERDEGSRGSPPLKSIERRLSHYAKRRKMGWKKGKKMIFCWETTICVQANVLSSEIPHRLFENQGLLSPSSHCATMVAGKEMKAIKGNVQRANPPLVPCRTTEEESAPFLDPLKIDGRGEGLGSDLDGRVNLSTFCTASFSPLLANFPIFLK